MVNEQTKLDWTQFESKKTGPEFLILQDKQEKLIGISRLEMATANFERKQKDGTMAMENVPQIHLVLDFVDGPLSSPMAFPTGAKYLIAQIKKHHETGFLYRFLFTLGRTGTGMATKYSFVPTQERPSSLDMPKSPPSGARSEPIPIMGIPKVPTA